jgi:glutathione-regulated potassium-efflux system ancillary protein KefG
MVIVAHPHLQQSRANKTLVNYISEYSNILVRDLYAEYPDWTINIEKEQQLLVAYERIVFQFPFYWYSCPPLLKKWLDDVMQFGWAYGPDGTNLKQKEFLLAITAGGTEKSYRVGGDNWYTVSEFIKPLQATIMRCHGTFLPPFIMYQSNKSNDEELLKEAEKYRDHILSPAKDLIH